jgi:hypothetical protein
VVCIYCLDEKECPEQFNREHVLPSAFGSFERALVLEKTVCSGCNAFFSGELELKFARDSIEGHARFAQGVRKASAFKPIGAGATSYVEVTEEGPWRGLLCRHIASTEGDALDLSLRPIPQVGFAATGEGPFTYFPLESLPTRAELEQRFGNTGFRALRIWEASFEVVRAQLEARGIGGAVRTDETAPPQGRVLGESVYALAQPEFRMIAKIAMNYLAMMLGAPIARMAHFNDIRSYIMNGRRGGVSPVTFAVNDLSVLAPLHSAIGWHTIALERRRNTVRAYVSLFGAVIYRVDLSAGPFHTLWDFRHQHRFDLADMHCREMRTWPPRFA